MDINEAEEEEALRAVDASLFEEVIWPVLYERVPAFQEIKVTSSWAGFYDFNTLDQVSDHLSSSFAVIISGALECDHRQAFGVTQFNTMYRLFWTWIATKRSSRSSCCGVIDTRWALLYN
jgi:hypothetical protein